MKRRAHLSSAAKAHWEQLLAEFCGISSPSGDLAGLHIMAKRCTQELEGFGFLVRLQDTGTGPVLVALSPHARPPFTLVVGHLDTVLPAGPVRRKGRKLYASGAVDMKGGIVTFLAALELLKEQQAPLPPNLAVVLVPDEESSGSATRQAMAEWGAHATLVLVVEPGEIVKGQETVVCGRKGMAEFMLRVHGQAAHSGLAFHQGRSALAAACHFVHRAESLTQGDLTLNVSRLVAGDGAFLDNLSKQADLLGTSARLNVVPDAAVCQGEFRFSEGKQGEEAKKALQALAQEVARQRHVRVEFAITHWVPPVDSRAGAWLAERAQRLAREVGLELAIEHNRGGVSLANFLERPDLPVLDGLGPVGGGMHTDEEFVSLDSLARRVRLLARLLQELAQVPPP